jgi:hypothetical protein
MGKKGKKKKSGIDWEEFVSRGVGGGSTGAADEDGGGWHTGPAAMALDSDDGDYGGGGNANGGSGAVDMAEAAAMAVGQHRAFFLAMGVLAVC